MKAKGIIFDMDGCLYPFDRGACAAFTESQFYRELIGNVQSYFMARFGLSAAEAKALYDDISIRFNGEVSLGLEEEHGIPRGEYFSATWNMEPASFMDRNPALTAALTGIAMPCALLSAAPRVWVNKVVDHLEVRTIFEPLVFSGDPDIRKPSPKAFQQVADVLGLDPREIVSIGDQELTDILPAQSLGMRTVRIGLDVGATAADFVAKDVPSAIAILKKENII